MPHISARTILRSATRDLHDRVDHLFSTVELSDTAGYGRFLSAQAAALLPCEAALDRAGAADVVRDWHDRHRSQALRDDLAALGLDVPDALTAPDFAGAAAILGGIYVLEGSRLGGAMLVREVPAGLPRAFLGASRGSAWRDLTQLIDATLTTEQQVRDAVEAARQVFGMFEDGARSQLEIR